MDGPLHGGLILGHTSSLKTAEIRDFPAGPVAKTRAPNAGSLVRSLIRELDPTCLKQNIPRAVTMTQHSQINKYLKKNKQELVAPQNCIKYLSSYNWKPTSFSLFPLPFAEA